MMMKVSVSGGDNVGRMSIFDDASLIQYALNGEVVGGVICTRKLLILCHTQKLVPLSLHSGIML